MWHVSKCFCISEEFIKQQLLDFQIGKRHLANMMGRDPEFFTEKDVDVSLVRFCLVKWWL